MEKLIYDSSNGLWYELQGDYYIPCLSLPKTKPIGRWGRKHLQYLQEHRKGLYAVLLTTGSGGFNVDFVFWKWFSSILPEDHYGGAV